MEWLSTTIDSSMVRREGEREGGREGGGEGGRESEGEREGGIKREVKPLHLLFCSIFHSSILQDDVEETYHS